MTDAGANGSAPSADLAALARGGRINFFGFIMRLIARLPFLFIAGRMYGAEQLGRFAYAVPVMAIAGSIAVKTRVPASKGTFPTDTPLFVGLLVGIILILGGLQFFPALALGPIVEHFSMLAGQTF